MTEEFTRVAAPSEIQADKMKMVQYKGQAICLANIMGKYYAIRNTCTHMGGPLAQGNWTAMWSNVHGTGLDSTLQPAK
jgi:3-phenylpropionate/trans-cinnamate dioxygenase ferredoxin subunit